MSENEKIITEESAENAENRNFIYNFIEEDIAPGGQYEGMTVHTRFPPEPNGYLHIGHCKALCIDFGMAEKFNGLCNLRMDDTNPAKEDTEYVEAIQEDIHWLGFDWGDRFFYGATTDETPLTLMQPLSFLRPGVTYTATLYADAPDADWQTNPYAYVIEQRTVTSNDTLTLPLAASGGCAISFLPL